MSLNFLTTNLRYHSTKPNSSRTAELLTIHAVWLPLEKHLKKHRPLYIAFLDVEKGFERVEHKLIWYALP